MTKLKTWHNKTQAYRNDIEKFIKDCRYYCSGNVTNVLNNKTINDYENEYY